MEHTYVYEFIYIIFITIIIDVIIIISWVFVCSTQVIKCLLKNFYSEAVVTIMLQYVCTYFIWKQYIYRIVLKIIYSDTFPAIRLCRYFVLFRYLHQSFDVVRFFVPRASCDVWYAYCYASPLGSQVYWWVQYWWIVARSKS